ncbi:hypothetical protein K3495_g13149 [Podosphaera aphanis]|nr:hypothetical protein K3495_g13149 [Podosphaera aphanis]
MGYQPYGEIDIHFPSDQTQQIQTYLRESEFCGESSEDQCKAVFNFIDHLESIRLAVSERSIARKEKVKERYDRGVHSYDKLYRLGDLVMLYDNAVAK